MEIIWFLLVGAIVGALARLILPGPDPIGILGTILLGIVGGLLGGIIWAALFDAPVGWIGSILAAVLVLWIYRRFTYARYHDRTPV